MPLVEILPPIVALAAALAAVAAVLTSTRTARTARRRAEAASRQLHALASRAERAEALIDAAPETIFAWPAGASEDTAPRLLGRIVGLAQPDGAAPLEGFTRMLPAPDRTRLEAALANLRRHGAGFSLALSTLDGQAFRAIGRPVGGQAVLWLGKTAMQDSRPGSETQSQDLAALLDALPLPVWRRGSSLDLTFVNQAYVAAVEGNTAEAVLAAGIELDSLARQLAHRARRAEESVRETRSVVMGGERRIVDVTEAPLGEGSFGFAVDRTALAEARQALDQHQRAQRDILDQLHRAIAIFGPDKALLFFNKSYAELFRLDPAYLATQPKDGEILELLREKRLLPEQANFPAWKRKRLALYNKLVEEPEEFWHLPDGRSLRVVCRAHPMGGLIYLYEDLTNRLALESSLKLLVGVQRASLDNLYEAIALFGSDGRLQLYNPAFLRIWSLDAGSLGQAPNFADVTQWCRGLLKNGETWDPLAARVTSLDPERRRATGRFEQRDGAIIDYAATPLPDGACLLTFVDVSDTARIERALRDRNEALETANRMKSDFVSHVSYQLRTPLNTIIGFSTMLDEAMQVEPLTEKQKDYVGNVRQASDQLRRLIDDILDLATIDAGRMTLDLADMDVADALNAAAALLHKRAQEGKLALDVRVAPDAGILRADARRIKQMVFNLISNAIAFTPPGGRITVGAERSGEEVRIFVADTGQGIAPRVQPTVFDRFESRGSEGRRGAGLGLSLVRSFVELHGGWVELQSEPGKGTVVTCHLPNIAQVEPEKRDAAA